MDYIFFNEPLCREFIAFICEHGIEYESGSPDAMGGDETPVFLVTLADDLPESLLEVLEQRYDALMEETATRVAQEEGWIGKRLAGVSATLPDGTTRTLRLDPELANKLLATFSTDEIHSLVNQIAVSMAAPEEPRLCRDPGPD
ncbi:MAG: hypothetical protein Q7S85_01020 [Rugosibacter sp.]|nr:hypothetical protein [Rugosibacter sp.]